MSNLEEHTEFAEAAWPNCVVTDRQGPICSKVARCLGVFDGGSPQAWKQAGDRRREFQHCGGSVPRRKCRCSGGYPRIRCSTESGPGVVSSIPRGFGFANRVGCVRAMGSLTGLPAEGCPEGARPLPWTLSPGVGYDLRVQLRRRSAAPDVPGSQTVARCLDAGY